MNEHKTFAAMTFCTVSNAMTKGRGYKCFYDTLTYFNKLIGFNSIF